MTGNENTRSPFLGTRWLAGLAAAAAVFAAAGAGSLRYSGLINRMGEWQFERLGFYLPMMSVLAWVAAFALFAALIARIVFRGKETGELVANAASHRATLLRNVLMVVGFIAGLVALGGTLNLVMLPGGGEADRLVTPSTLILGSKEGNARLQGFRVAGPMARYSEGVLFWKKDTFLVPLTGAAQGEQDGVRLFAQVTQYEAGTRLPSSYRGVLRLAALPRELYPLYAAQGVGVQDNAAVLFRDTFSMALPTLLLIGEAALVAIAAFTVALILNRRRNRLAAE